MRAFLIAVLEITVRIFFRRVEVRGRERIPASARVIFVLNHPNGLVDPLFVLLRSGRRVCFLAKAPLFRMPVIGTMLRAAHAIPVYRKQDDAGDTSRNQETFAAARAVLSRGEAIAIFPEGTSHSDPALKPLKTGAARIALSATAEGPVHVVPAGLYYTSKGVFRSAALVWFGDPISLPPTATATTGEPDPDAVRRLTAAIAAGLREVTLQADRAEALRIVARAERVLASDGSPVALAEEVDVRRRLEEGYATLRERMPARVEALVGRLDRFEAELRELGITPRTLAPRAYTAGRVSVWTVTRLTECALILPLALPGLLLHLPAYLAVDRLARSYAGDLADVVATAKILTGMLLFPVTWVGIAWGTWWLTGKAALGGLAALVLAPCAGYAALRFLERLDGFRVALRAFVLYVLGRGRFNRLVREREGIRQDILSLASHLP